MRLGLIGCGGCARLGHLPAIQSVPGWDLHAVCDVNEQNLQRVQSEFAVPHAFTDPDAFLASGIEAVTVTSAALAHRQNVLDAARQGLPVLCEKPLALNEAHSAEMIAAMEQAGAPLYTAFCYRFSPPALKIRELIREKALGELRTGRLIYNWSYGGKYEAGSANVRPYYDGRMREGGPMMDCGQHQIDLARWWADSEVVDVTGCGSWVEDYEAPDHSWAHLRHENGTHSMVEISYSYGHMSKKLLNEFTYELIGTEGVIRYDRSTEQFVLHDRDGSHAMEYHHNKGFTGMYEHYLQAVANGGGELLATGHDGLRAVQIAHAAVEQAIAEHEGQFAPGSS